MSGTPIIGRKVLRYAQVESTNTLAAEFAERGEPEGLVISADEQLAGRGRMGRKWTVPRGTSLQFSILLYPPLAPQHASRLMPMTALAVAQTLEQELSLRSTLKWPNDVMLNGKKVCGILIESSIQSDRLSYVVLGIGLNINFSMTQYPELASRATTVQDELGHQADKAALESRLWANLDAAYARIRRGESLHNEYRERLAMLGAPIRVSRHGETLEGIAEDVDQDGALILRSGNSSVKLFAGDVTILKPQEVV